MKLTMKQKDMRDVIKILKDCSTSDVQDRSGK